MLGVAAFAVVIERGVGSVSGGEKSVNMNVKPDVDVRARMEVGSTSLLLQYDVQSRSDKVIYVFDRLTSFDAGKTKVEPDQAFVLLDGAGGVRIVCALLPTPSLTSVAQRPSTYVSVVAPRSAHSGRLQLTLPLVERHAFYAIIGKADGAAVPVHRVVFQLGWVEQRPGMELLDRESTFGPEVQLAGGWGKPTQWISEVVLPASGLQVVKHPEPFERSRPLE
jgi:hypothetical protein